MQLIYICSIIQQQLADITLLAEIDLSIGSNDGTQIHYLVSSPSLFFYCMQFMEHNVAHPLKGVFNFSVSKHKKIICGIQVAFLIQR